MKSIYYLWLFLLLSPACQQSALRHDQTPSSTSSNRAATATELVDLINQSRQKAGLTRLTVNPILVELAQQHARDMVRENFYGHRNLAGQDTAQRIAAAGLSAKVTGEILARGRASASQIVNAWLHSSIHRQNIMDPNFVYIGAARVQRPHRQQSYYWVVDFCSR